MRRLRAWLVRMAGSFHKERRDRELGQEIESNLQLHMEDNLRAGMAPEEARRQALIKLGGIEATKVTPLDKTGFDVVTPQVEIFCRQVLERVKALPGVESAALIDWLPMSERADNPSRGFSIAGRSAALRGEKPRVFYSAISPDYFGVMQIPLLRGRYPAEQDTYSAPWAVVINDVRRGNWCGCLVGSYSS
jgi:hypothetical protein